MLRHITWELFLEDYIKPCVPARYRLKGKPDISFYVSDKAERIGLNIRVDQNKNLPDLPLKELAFELKSDNEGYYADFSTDNASLFEHFYSMMCFISDSVQIKGHDFVEAVIEAVEKLKNLISNVKLLSEENIIGIWGELWLLEQLFHVLGSKSVYLWKGADKAIHDFRLNGIELEIKTTRNEDRDHVISRLSQLESSPEMNLYLCSIQIVESSSEGSSLTEFVKKIEAYLKEDIEALSCFKRKLDKEGYKYNQSRFYNTRYYLRTVPEIVHINEKLPRIYRNMIDREFGKKAVRISNVKYNVDVTGLGVEFNIQQLLK